MRERCSRPRSSARDWPSRPTTRSSTPTRGPSRSTARTGARSRRSPCIAAASPTSSRPSSCVRPGGSSSLPLLDLPPVADLERELAERARRPGRPAPTAGETRTTMNPIRYHISWLETMLAQEAAGGRATAIDGEIWAAPLGDCAIVGAPGEIFGAIGTAVRARRRPRDDLRRTTARAASAMSRRPTSIPWRLRAGDLASWYGQPAPFSPEVAGIIERDGGGAAPRAVRVSDADLAAAIARGDADRLALRAPWPAAGRPAATLLAPAGPPHDAGRRCGDGAQGRRRRHRPGRPHARATRA